MKSRLIRWVFTPAVLSAIVLVLEAGRKWPKGR